MLKHFIEQPLSLLLGAFTMWRAKMTVYGPYCSTRSYVEMVPTMADGAISTQVKLR